LSDFAWVLLKAAAVLAPLLAVARLGGVFPHGRLVVPVLCAGLASSVLVWLPEAVWFVGAVDALLVLAAAVDLATLPRRGVLSVQRETGRVVSIRKRHPVTLTVVNRSRRTFQATVRDGVPQCLAPEPDEFATELPASSRTILTFDLRPSQRGAFRLAAVYLRVRSRWGLWRRFLCLPVESVVHVYPDMKQLGHYSLLARTNRLRLMGVRRVRRIGRDHDFERLRDYTLDDNYKHIEWRATARRRKLTVKDYQASQSQRLVFLLDCGRMMTNEAAGLSLLDHALNAVLMLSYVALREGDSVGLIAFSDEIHVHVPARGGMHQMNRLLHASFDRFPRLVESRYDLAFRYLATHVRKRSLAILATNVIDEVNSRQIEQYLANLTGRHLPLGVLLRDRRIFEAVEAEHPSGDAIWNAAAAADILAWRHQAIRDLRSKGVLTLDVFPEEMTAPLVNRYLEIKARHLL
jgi:uncharacterized protein (DUF58 family)